MHALTHLALIRLTGPDAHRFLQGQLSNDLDLLTPDQSLLACCNSAQGRVQAVLRLVERTDGIHALLPRSMLETTLARLRKYQLRAKVSIESAADSLQAFSASAEELAQFGFTPALTVGVHQQQEVTSLVRWPDATQPRYLVVQPGPPLHDPQSDAAWQLADIRAGLPQVLPETHEHFVAQMLNLDTLGAISFNKGCYTGQEIIARAHFRGTVKRSMVRYAANCPAPPPGTRIVVGVDAAGEVVMAAEGADGCELLAVVSVPQQGLELTFEGTNSVLKPLPLPYDSVATG